MSPRFVSLLAVVLLGAAPAVPEPTPVVGKRLDIPLEKYTLPNGLEVILNPDHRVPTATVNLWYHVGAFNESPGRSGFAHFFEHMMFLGSRNLPDGDYIARLEQIGASSVNATTDFDRTNYFETVPTSQLERVLWMESDRMGFLLDTLSEKKLATQREVVKNERRERVDTSPYGEANEKLVRALFPEPHPYHGSIIGSMRDLDAASLEDIRQFFEHWYAPANATLVVAGDIDPPAVKELVAKYFGTLRATARPKVPAVVPAVVKAETVIRHEEHLGKLPRLEMAWLTPAFFKDGNAALDLLTLVLGGGRQSRLERRLVTERKVAQSVHVTQESLYQQSVVEVSVTGRPGVSTETLQKEVDAVLDEVRTHGVTADEVLRARNRSETAKVSSMQSASGLGGRADLLQLYNHYLGRPDMLGADLERYAQVTPDSILMAAREYLRPDRRVVVHSVPVPASTSGAEVSR